MSYHSLEDLVSLAQRTNSKLIVRDQLDGNDVVVLSVDEFERLTDCENDSQTPWRPDVREMSEGELLDQINRDIATWRVNKDQEEEWTDETDLEEGDEVGAEESETEENWHSVAKILENKLEKEPDLPQPVSYKPNDDGIIEKGTPITDDEPMFYEEPV